QLRGGPRRARPGPAPRHDLERPPRLQRPRARLRPRHDHVEVPGARRLARRRRAHDDRGAGAGARGAWRAGNARARGRGRRDAAPARGGRVPPRRRDRRDARGRRPARAARGRQGRRGARRLAAAAAAAAGPGEQAVRMSCWVSSRLTPALRSGSAVGSMARLRGEGRRYTSEFLGWRAPLQGQGEPFVVVPSLPCSKGAGRLVEVCKPVASPKLLLVDPMATLHLPVLLGPPRPNVAMPDAGRFDRKHEVERKLSAVVALQLADPEGKRLLELDQKRQAGASVKPSVEAQDPKASAVVQGRVLERPASRNLHELNVHLDAFARLRLLEELHLPGDPLPRPPKTRDAEIAKNALDRAHGNADVVNAAKPELSPEIG